MSYTATASSLYYNEVLGNEAAIEKAYSERNKHLGLSKAEFKEALAKYFDYRTVTIFNSGSAQNAAMAAKDALEQRKNNGPTATESVKEYVKAQNIADVELANILAIQISTLKRFEEAAAYVTFLHQDSKK